MTEYPQEFLDLLESVTSKRPRTVIQHILKNGYITTEDLKEKYGYNHPPRAIRDVKELGIPIETYRVTGSDGRKIAAYKFGDPSKKDQNISKSSGRTAISKNIRNKLIEKYGPMCFIYLETTDPSLLQVDHRIPFEIGGEVDQNDLSNYMLLCPSANRAKSWACEHCSNWTKKDVNYCKDCYWAFPESYTHVADSVERRIELVYYGEEILDYNEVKQTFGKHTEKQIKLLLKKFVEDQNKENE